MKRLWLWIALIGAVVVIGFIAGPPANGGKPFDPRSSSGNGTKAMVILLQQLGARVTLSSEAPASGTDVAVVLSDELTAERRDALVAWADAGGTLVVADPRSDLQQSAPVRVGHGFVTTAHVDGPCPAAGLGDVGRVATGGAYFLRLPQGAEGCFGSGGAYLLVTERAGAGHFVGLGGAGPFTNSLLGRDDNSVLVADLLLPRAGANVTVMLPSPVGGGHKSPWQLLNRPTKLALLQLMIAVAAVAVWRVRRLGRPVREVQPVQLAGSELTIAVGNLMARAGRRDAAAAELRADLRRWLGQRFGLGPQAAPDVLAAAAAARSGVETERVLAAVVDQPVDSDARLVELAQELEHLRQEVVHGHA